MLECSGDGLLGMENGRITRQQISVSSTYDRYHGPENARLKLPASRGKIGAWCSEKLDSNQFLQVDFLQNVKLTKFATQGRQDKLLEWVTKYKLAYSPDGSSETFQIYQEDGSDKV